MHAAEWIGQGGEFQAFCGKDSNHRFPEDRRLTFSAPDGVSVSALHRPTGCPSQPRLILVAPGYAQHSATRSMQTLARALSALADVLVLDFRGNGASAGRFTFGAREYLDLLPALAWARRYQDVTLMGFSLGAYHSLRAADACPDPIRRLLLISCPTRVEEIVTSGGALWNPLTLLFRRVRFQHPPENDQHFRWAWPFMEKPDGTVLAARLPMPCHFLAGGRDALVFGRLTQKVYAAIPGEKTYTHWPEGVHAEEMFMQHPDTFLDWVEMHLGKDKR